MRVLVITEVDPAKFINHRVTHLINFLQTKDCDLTVIRPLPKRHLYKRWQRLFPSIQKFRTENRTEQRVRGWRLSPFPRYRDAISSADLFSHKNLEIYDLCFAEGPWAGALATRLQQKNQIKFFVYEDLDLFVEFIDPKPFNLQRREMEQLEKNSLLHADLVVCVGNELKKLRQRITSKPIIVVPNGVDYSHFSRRPTAENDQGLSQWEMVYTGSIEEWAGLQLIISALPHLVSKFSRIHFTIIGQGRYENDLRKLTQNLNLTEVVSFLGKKDYHELPLYLWRAQVGLAMFAPSPLTHYAFPLKIIEYMASCLGVIATKIGETQTLLEESKAGIAIPYDEKHFIDTILSLAQEPSLLTTLGENGKAFASSYDWNQLFKYELETIEKEIKHSTVYPGGTL